LLARFDFDAVGSGRFGLALVVIGSQRAPLANLSISRFTYHAALRKSSVAFFDLSPARQRYLMAFPMLNPQCSAMVTHSTPLGWDV
jgi:hypothetical protein